jgi:hypothetical protein
MSKCVISAAGVSLTFAPGLISALKCPPKPPPTGNCAEGNGKSSLNVGSPPSVTPRIAKTDAASIFDRY